MKDAEEMEKHNLKKEHDRLWGPAILASYQKQWADEEKAREKERMKFNRIYDFPIGPIGPDAYKTDLFRAAADPEFCMKRLKELGHHSTL